MSMGYLGRLRGVASGASFVFLIGVVGGCSTDSRKGEDTKRKAATADSVGAQQSAAKVRDDALASAHVWSRPGIPIGQARLRDNPPGPGSIGVDEELSCRFKPETMGGTTPKFSCELPTGEVLKVKYGTGNPELRAEVAATRLLAALGFGADHMYVVKNVQCAGCPRFPFQALKCLKATGATAVCFPGGIDYTRIVTFDTAVIERRVEGRKIEAVRDQGWAWYELNKVDAARSGSPLAELDALRLIAVVLAHWDNKAENQRLICPPAADRPDGGCDSPQAMVQDLGATFGPLKVDLNNWRKFRVWADASTCTISMKPLPFGGATFVDWRVSEAGRTLLLGWLDQLSDQQLRDLFEGSHITDYDQVTAEARGAEAWVKAFREKVTQIREGGPCPGVTAS